MVTIAGEVSTSANYTARRETFVMRSTITPLTSLMACAATLAIACSGSPTEPSPTPLTVPLTSTAWETISDPQPYPLTNAGAALAFDFPSTGSIQYVFTASALAAIRGTLVASFTIASSGPVIFNSLDPQTATCTVPASVRPFIWANNNGQGSYDRWWSNPLAFTLAPGAGSVSVPLKPENWSSVNGQRGNASEPITFAFETALRNVSRLGLTFGGGCSFGHGINVQGGTATFMLTELAIR
jgi:hypothetical protein